MRNPNQNVKSSNRVHSYILRPQKSRQYVEQQTDSISKLAPVSSKLQLPITSSTLQLSTNQLYSHFSGTTEPRPRQTVPIPCLLFYFSWNARTQTSPDSPYPVSFSFRWSHRTQTSPDSPYSILTFLYFSWNARTQTSLDSPYPISFSFLSFLQKLFSEPMHVCKPAHVCTLQRLATWSTTLN